MPLKGKDNVFSSPRAQPSWQSISFPSFSSILCHPKHTLSRTLSHGCWAEVSSYAIFCFKQSGEKSKSKHKQRKHKDRGEEGEDSEKKERRKSRHKEGDEGKDRRRSRDEEGDKKKKHRSKHSRAKSEEGVQDDVTYEEL